MHIPSTQASVVQASPSTQSAATAQVTAQSMAQVMFVSLPSQVPSPQHSPLPWTSEQTYPSLVQRGSLQSTSDPQQ